MTEVVTPKVDAQTVLGQTPSQALGPVMTDALNKVPLIQIPASAITDVFVVADQAAMLALVAEVGDVAKRTDLSKSFILQALPPATLGNWIVLSGDYEPLGAVATHTAIPDAHHTKNHNLAGAEHNPDTFANLSAKLSDAILATIAATLIQGGVPFADALGKLTQDSTKLYWDNVNKRLGIGTNTPAQALDLVGNLLTQGQNILGGATYPRQDALYNWGSPSFRWLNGYMSGNLIIDGLVDGVDVANHAARHSSAGADVITPAAIAAAPVIHAHAPADVTGTAVVTADSRLSDARIPTGSAGGDLTGSTYPNPVVAALAITDSKVAVANKDGTAITPSMRTLGTGALQACAGNDTRLSDTRVDTTALHKAIASEISAMTEKVTPLVADLVVIESAADANAKRKVQIGNLFKAGAYRQYLTHGVQSLLNPVTYNMEPVPTTATLEAETYDDLGTISGLAAPANLAINWCVYANTGLAAAVGNAFQWPRVRIPANWIPGTPITIRLTWVAPDAVVGNVRWVAGAAFIGAGDIMGDKTQVINVGNVIGTTPGVAWKRVDSEIVYDGAGALALDTIVPIIGRDGEDVLDTYAGSVRLAFLTFGFICTTEAKP